MDGQDWSTTVLKKTPARGKESKGRVPDGTHLERKYGGTNKQRPTTRSASTIEAIADAEDSPSRKKEVNPELKTEVIKARVARGWKQKDLATNASIQLKAVQALEQGKMPVQADFQRIVRALGLRGLKKTK